MKNIRFVFTWLCRVAAVAGVALMSSGVHAVTGGATWIEGGQTFMLGGEQKSAFTVEGKNTGNVAVEIFVQDREGRKNRTRLVRLEPGQTFAASVDPGHVALFKNTVPNKRAVMKLKLTDEIAGLSMRYESTAAK